MDPWDLDLSVGEPPAPDIDETLPDDDPFAGWGDGDTPPEAAPAPSVVTEAQVRALLAAGGRGLGSVVGDDDVPGHWHFTDDELDAITPPLTRAVNRSPRLVRAVEQSDTAVIAVTLGAYGWRNIDAGVKASRARALDGPEASHGFDGEAGSDPTGGDPVADRPSELVQPVATGPGSFAPDWPG